MSIPGLSGPKLEQDQRKKEALQKALKAYRRQVQKKRKRYSLTALFGVSQKPQDWKETLETALREFLRWQFELISLVDNDHASLLRELRSTQQFLEEDSRLRSLTDSAILKIEYPIKT